MTNPVSSVDSTTKTSIAKTQCFDKDSQAYVAVLILRLILIPTVSFGLIKLTIKPPVDTLFLFLLIIQAGMPSAMSIPMMFTQLHRTKAIDPLAKSLLLQYTFSLITLTILVASALYYSINLSY